MVLLSTVVYVLMENEIAVSYPTAKTLIARQTQPFRISAAVMTDYVLQALSETASRS